MTTAARRLVGAVPKGALLALMAAACKLEVTDPAIVDPESLNTVQALPALRAGAIADFKTAYSGTGGNTEGIILHSGLRADEWRNADTFEGRQQVDRGDIPINNGENQGVFRNLQQARLSAELAVRRYAALDTAAAGFTEMLNLAGFAYIFFGENYCSGIPFSEYDENSRITEGTALTRDAIFTRAIAKFDSALASRGGRTAGSVQNQLGRIGKARALLNLGRFTEATALVTAAAVPTSFVYNIEHSENTTSQNNGVFFLNNVNRRWSVADLEGINGLPFRTLNDPRLPNSRQRTAAGAARNGLDARTPLFQQFKYPERKADIPLANGIEARLIEAEAALRAGNRAGFLAIHNTLRATRSLYRCPTVATQGYVCPDTGFLLAPLVLSGSESQNDLVKLHFRERALWLWSTAHRLGDMRRLVRPVASGGYGFTIGEIFPQGPYPKGGAPYGNAVSFPIPVDEKNNSNFTDYTGCDTSIP